MRHTLQHTPPQEKTCASKVKLSTHRPLHFHNDSAALRFLILHFPSTFTCTITSGPARPELEGTEDAAHRHRTSRRPRKWSNCRFCFVDSSPATPISTIESEKKRWCRCSAKASCIRARCGSSGISRIRKHPEPEHPDLAP